VLSENAVNIKVRIKFSKTGSLKFISHLDLQRTMQSSFLRSKLPIYYSEGFNPHPKVVFSPPLSVGVSSLTEFVDVKMLENVSFGEIMEKLNASFPKGLRAHECYTPETKFNDVKWGLYEIKYELVGEIPADICEKAKTALTAEEINVEKFSKKTGAKTVNIAGGVRFCSAELEGNILTVRTKLSCDDATFVNPKYVSETLACAMPEAFACAEEEVCRMEVYLADGETLFK
jgi:radical SAM-linked protein